MKYIESLQSKLGQLLWISGQTRPDVSFHTCHLATRLKDGKVKDLIFANKVIPSLQTETVQLRYQNLGLDDSLKIVIFADAAHGNLPDGGSQGGELIFLVGDSSACSLIGWTSKRIKRVVKSSLAAETLSVSEAVDGTVYANAMFSEINYGGPRDYQ